MDNRERFIIHLNVADFAVAVERMSDCRLKERPVIIAPQGAPRATVYDMSEEAFQNGVRKGMLLSTARKRCKEARVVSTHFHCYESAAKALVQCALTYSPLVEMTDVNGHLFVDATGTSKLFGPAPDVAWRIRKEVRKTLGADPIWSVAPNKLIAKVATRLVKPVGEYIVGAGDEAGFLAPVPLSLIPGIDPKDLHIFHTLNTTCAGQAASWSEDQLEVLFEKRSRPIHEAVRGIDPSPVLPVTEKQPVISATHEFGEDAHDPRAILGALYALVEEAGRQLRTRRLAARHAEISLDYSDGGHSSRGVKVHPATDNDLDLFASARQALSKAWVRRVRIQRLQLTCSRLDQPSSQLFLFEEPGKKRSKNLISTLDAIRERFGTASVQMGRTLNAFA
jgi:DNA polymerase-4